MICSNAEGVAHPVGEKIPNGFGLMIWLVRKSGFKMPPTVPDLSNSPIRHQSTHAVYDYRGVRGGAYSQSSYYQMLEYRTSTNPSSANYIAFVPFAQSRISPESLGGAS